MNTPTAVLAGFAMIALAIYAGNGTPAFSQSDEAGGGPYQFGGYPDDRVIWVLNSNTGEMRVCFADTENAGCEIVHLDR